jgi:hypothetical protein
MARSIDDGSTAIAFNVRVLLQPAPAASHVSDAPPGQSGHRHADGSTIEDRLAFRNSLMTRRAIASQRSGCGDANRSATVVPKSHTQMILRLPGGAGRNSTTLGATIEAVE